MRGAALGDVQRTRGRDLSGFDSLRAAALGFEHPITGEPLRFESPPPEDFTRLVKALRVQRGDIAATPAALK